MSLSARRAWIEILGLPIGEKLDRVALRKESVDRNPNYGLILSRDCVALRKESVDRNLDNRHIAWYATMSLSARRAWIEM